MTIHNIKAELYIGLGKKKVSVDSWNSTIPTSDSAIDTFGSIWGERQVLNLGTHFNLYSTTNEASWILNNQLNSAALATLPSSIKAAPTKLPGGSVSGNFGEVLTVFVLQHKVPPRRDISLRVGHLCPTQGLSFAKCPDLLVERGPLSMDYKRMQERHDQLPDLPAFLPAECKNSDTLGALRQIVEYWRMAGPQNSCYGFGLISSISYKSTSTLTPSITFNLLVPNKGGFPSLAWLFQQPQFSSAQVVIKDLKGIMYGF